MLKTVLFCLLSRQGGRILTIEATTMTTMWWTLELYEYEANGMRVWFGTISEAIAYADDARSVCSINYWNEWGEWIEEKLDY